MPFVWKSKFQCELDAKRRMDLLSSVKPFGASDGPHGDFRSQQWYLKRKAAVYGRKRKRWNLVFTSDSRLVQEDVVQCRPDWSNVTVDCDGMCTVCLRFSTGYSKRQVLCQFRTSPSAIKSFRSKRSLV